MRNVKEYFCLNGKFILNSLSDERKTDPKNVSKNFNFFFFKENIHIACWASFQFIFYFLEAELKEKAQKLKQENVGGWGLKAEVFWGSVSRQTHRCNEKRPGKTRCSPHPALLVTSPARDAQRSRFGPSVVWSTCAHGTISPPSLAAESSRHPREEKHGVCSSVWGICSLLGSMAKIILISVALHWLFLCHTPSCIGTFSFGPAPLVPHRALQHPARRGEISASSPAGTCPLCTGIWEAKFGPLKVK